MPIVRACTSTLQDDIGNRQRLREKKFTEPMMAKVREELVEISALKGGYQFGFHDPDPSVFRARKGSDREIVAHMSAIIRRTRLAY